MPKKIVIIFEGLNQLASWFLHEFWAFSVFFYKYINKKILKGSGLFEKQKNFLVRFFLMKRGKYNRPFLHIVTMAVLGIGVFIAPIIADTYPLFTKPAQDLSNLANAEQSVQSIVVDENVFSTQESEKPRAETITYTVQKGDTLSTISKKFGISVETIKWANDLKGDSITVGDTLSILPITGIMHKVQSGETVFSIAKKYDTDPQKIVDYDFNDFANPETFALVVGQNLIVPDGIISTPQQPAVRRQVYVVSGPLAVSNLGFTWPLRGGISQFPSWYHMALDITAPYGTPIVAAQDGKVSVVTLGTWDGGYGNNVWVTNGAGLSSHYAHMARVFVNSGDSVVAGKTVIGEVGLTGRTTGAHLHFEIQRDGVLVNPLPYLQ